MTNHQFFHVEGTRVVSDIFPSYHSRPEDPHQTAEALNRMYNTEYTAALTEPGSNANFIPPDKALHIAYYFENRQEIKRAKENVTKWVDNLSLGSRVALEMYLEHLAILPKISAAHKKAAQYIINHI